MVESTHDLAIGEREVVKRFRSWEQGEPEREWLGLNLMHRFSPGLGPEPLRREIEDGIPTVVMSRVPGESLGSSPLTVMQVDGLAAAMRTMFWAVPSADLADIPERRLGPRELIAGLRDWSCQPHERCSPKVETALAAGTKWLRGPATQELSGPLAERAFALADGNLGNYLWDGEHCHVVDFEDSGASDPAYELADLIEHVSVWLADLLPSEALVERLRFDADQRRRLSRFRPLYAVFWLLMLLPGNPGHHRNPAGSVERQAQRVLDLLNEAN